MTEQRLYHLPQFYLTPTGPCPYLPGRQERKVFTRLTGPLSHIIGSSLTISGFRRSQSIAYKPSCEGCNACISVRIPANGYEFSRNEKRTLRRNRDLTRTIARPHATRGQYALLRAYLDARHSGGGMDDMSLFEYAAMVEETPLETRLFEYRMSDTDELVACALTDVISDGFSMVYSFFHPGLSPRSLGTFMILDHVREAQKLGLSYIYLGYWVRDCHKMRYKQRFQPLEILTGNGWHRMVTPGRKEKPSAPDET